VTGTPGPRDGGGRPTDPPAHRDAGPPLPGCPAGSETLVTGRVRFPNGELPVAGAIVYVPHGEPGAVARSGECGECIDSAGLAAWTTTAPDGSFTLRGLAAGRHALVVEKGLFKRITDFEVVACTDNAVDAEQIRLPRNQREGRIPRIAVVTGVFDHMEEVLVKLGLDETSFDVFASDFESVSAPDEAEPLFRDAARLATYDIVFVNCGASVAESWLHPVYEDPAVQANLRAFVEGGGRLYATDLAYDLVEAALPRFVDFQEGGEGLADRPETGDSAQVGDELMTVDASIEDPDLGAWLVATGAIPSPDRMPVQGLLGGWSVVERVDVDRARVWVSADVSWGSGPALDPGGIPGRGVRPLTLSFEAGCGRALFTSYHTVEGSRSTGLTAQEQALAYLVLEIGACIEEPQLI
jgi:hypothetical protein